MPNRPDIERDGAIAGESGNVYEAIFREMSDAAFLIDVEQSDEDYTFTYRRNNASHQDLLGLSEDELCGQTPQELLGDQQGTVVAENYQECVEKGDPIEYEEKLELPGGTSDLQTQLTPITGSGQVTQIVGVARDITEQKEQERQLKRIHRRFGTVMETMAAAVFLKDADGQYLMMNQACRELFDIGDQDIAGLTDEDLFPPDTAEQTRTDDRRVFENGEMIEIEETVPTTAGNTVRLTRKSPVYGEDDEVVALCGVSTDITEHKKREQELQMVHERFERFSHNVQDAFFMVQADYSETEYVNQAVEPIYGITPEEAHNDPTAWLRHVHPDDKGELLANTEAQQSGTVNWPVQQEFRVEHPDRGTRWVQASIEMVTGENGAPTWFAGVSTDITERKQAEQQLKENKERLTEQNTALESLAQIITDTERTVDQQITDLLDLGTTYLDLDVGILSEIDGSEYTVRNVVDPSKGISPGDSFDLTDTYCSLVYDADGPVSFHSATDGGVKDHPAYEKQGIESYIGVPVFVDDQRYGTLNFSRPESRDAPITDAEESFVRIMAQWLGTEFNRQQRKAELKRTSQFLQDSQEVANIGGWEVDLQSETSRWSEELYRIHGLPLDANPTPKDGIELYHPDDRDSIREAFDRLTTEGKPYDLELRIVTADDEMRWVRTRGTPRYENDELVAVHGTFQDITERKEREQELRRQNSRLNEFASVVSHDLRNPLNVAQARATILQQRADDELQEDLTPLVRSLDRLESIIEDTLTLARQGETVGEMNSIPVVDLIGKCWAGVETGKATLEIEDEFTLRGDHDRLRHVFENLFRNAVEHAGEDVAVRVGRCGENCLYIEDDGPGIPPDDRGAVFEPGHTSAGGGTGFGLTIVKRIAEAHGWEVAITDGRDGGARFEFDTAGLPDE
jgi:PAS domain S-box-containing protein